VHDVFISYSTKDQNQAETVRSVLENNGISCWMAPRDIPTGSNYTKEIPIAIRDCQVFVLILSQNSQNSHWVLKELDSAVNHAKVILPFMLENCQLNEEFNFLLTGAQRYEAYKKKSDSLEALITRIRAITNPQTESSVQNPPPQQEKSPVYHRSVRCPACNSANWEELPKKTGKYTVGEKAVGILPLVLGVVFMFAGVFIMAVVTTFMGSLKDSVFFSIMSFGMIGGAVFGFIFGNTKARNRIRRQRIRNGIVPHPLRCKACQKEFLVKRDQIV